LRVAIDVRKTRLASLALARGGATAVAPRVRHLEEPAELQRAEGARPPP